MKVGKVTLEVNTLANKSRPYLYNEMFALAKEHKVQGEFGKYFIDLYNPPKELIKSLEDAKIKFDIFA
jgi:hypothetical protein